MVICYSSLEGPSLGFSPPSSDGSAMKYLAWPQEQPSIAKNNWVRVYCWTFKNRVTMRLSNRKLTISVPEIHTTEEKIILKKTFLLKHWSLVYLSKNKPVT
jgi:hypothetical protein